MKTTIRVIVAAFGLTIFSLSTVVVQAQSYTNSYGVWGYATVTNDTITITGYTGSGGDVVIPDTINDQPVTSIGSGAFNDCINLTSVTIPDSVTFIGESAFYDCTSLTNVMIGNSVTSIGSCAFAGSGLVTVTIPNSVTVIEDGCWGPKGLSTAGAFSGCTSLTNVMIGNSVTYIGSWAFQYCPGLTSITIPNSVTSIGEGAFSGCTSLSSVTIPNSVTNIGQGAFSGCTSLSSVTVGNSVNNFGAYAFQGCTNLTSVTVPNSVTSIGYAAFAGCTSLVGVHFEGDAPSLSAEVFSSTPATVYYLAGTTGWDSTFGGRPTIRVGPPELGVNLYAGLSITGAVGTVYSVEYVTDLAQTNTPSAWRCLEYLQLPASPYLWADKSSPATGQRFYRAVQMQAPTNMVFIPPGTFRMGSPTNEVDRYEREGPQTAVSISRGYWMGKYEVTQGEYLAVMGSNPSRINGVHENWPYVGTNTDFGTDLSRPVETVTWDDATNYCGTLTQRERAAGRIATNSEYRLPTEAEWEYACRGWTSTRFNYGDDPGYTNLTDYAWYSENSGWMTHPVGQKLPNPWGLYDMHGNVWECCQDWYGDYTGGIAVDPQGPSSGPVRVIRGGGWSYWDFDVGAGICRSAIRIAVIFVEQRSTFIGFRVVLAPGQP